MMEEVAAVVVLGLEVASRLDEHVEGAVIGAGGAGDVERRAAAGVAEFAIYSRVEGELDHQLIANDRRLKG